MKPAPWTTQSGAPSADEASVRDAGYGASAPPWPRGDGRAGGAERADVEGGLPAEEKEARPTEALLLRPLLQKRADSDPAHVELVRLATLLPCFRALQLLHQSRLAALKRTVCVKVAPAASWQAARSTPKLGRCAT